MGPHEDYYAANVTGTKNVLRACQEHGIGKLVFTGSPSVVFDGRDVEGWSEEAPYPPRFDSPTTRTKAQAEEMVLAANHDKLATVSLRPHLIWGPGDRHLLPRIAAKARAGRLFRIGKKNKLIDTIYIDDAVEAHILAAVAAVAAVRDRGQGVLLVRRRSSPRLGDRRPHARGPACRPSAVRSGRPGERRRRRARPPGAPSALVRAAADAFSRLPAATAHWFDITAARRPWAIRPA